VIESFPGARGAIVVLRLAGEFDMSTDPFLREVLDRELASHPVHLIVDLAEVTFCGCAALRRLVDIEAPAIVGGTRYAWSGLSPQLSRACAILWEDQHRPVCYPSVASAVTAMA
jgi:anti-anti-sigma factor